VQNKIVLSNPCSKFAMWASCGELGTNDFFSYSAETLLGMSKVLLEGNPGRYSARYLRVLPRMQERSGRAHEST